MRQTIGDPRIVTQNVDAGTTTYFHWDPSTDGFTLEERQDAEPAIELNKLRMNEVGSGWKGELHMVASIPLVVVTDLQRKGIWRDKERLRAWLNERDNRAFRTRPGRV